MNQIDAPDKIDREIMGEDVPQASPHPQSRGDVRATKGQVRVETRVSQYIREQLEPLAKEHMLAKELVKAAEGIGLVEAFKWLSLEELTPHEVTSIIWVTPSAKLLDKCARWYVGPQLLIRAAAIKMATKLKRAALQKTVSEPEPGT